MESVCIQHFILLSKRVQTTNFIVIKMSTLFKKIWKGRVCINQNFLINNSILMIKILNFMDEEKNTKNSNCVKLIGFYERFVPFSCDKKANAWKEKFRR